MGTKNQGGVAMEAYGGRIVIGSKVGLEVTEYNGRVGFKPAFYDFDPEVAGVLGGRSVRFYVPAVDSTNGGQSSALQTGEVWEGIINSFNVTDSRTKDNRVMVFIGVKQLRRRTESFLCVTNEQLIERVMSGMVLVSERVISQLTEKWFRFRFGDTLVEFRALATQDGKPVQLLSSPRVQTRKQFFDQAEKDLGRVWELSKPSVRSDFWDKIPVASSQEAFDQYCFGRAEDVNKLFLSDLQRVAA